MLTFTIGLLIYFTIALPACFLIGSCIHYGMN